MTADKLNSYTLKDLTTLAQKRGVAGWHDMRKDQLVRALLRLAQRAKAVAPKAVAPKTNGKKHAVATRIEQARTAPSIKPVASRLSNRRPPRPTALRAAAFLAAMARWLATTRPACGPPSSSAMK